MVDFSEFDKIIKEVERWINQTLTKGLVVIFHSLFQNFFRLKFLYVFDFSIFLHFLLPSRLEL